MKKLSKELWSILVISSLIYCSCKSSSNDNNNDSNEYIYEIPAGTTKVSFPSECNGKKAFAIYLNQTSGNVTKGNGGIKFNQINENAYRSASENDGMNIYEDSIEFEDGGRRSEVHFELPFLPDKNNNFARTVDANSHYSYNERTGNINETGEFYAQMGPSNTAEDVTTKPFTLKATGTHCKIWYFNTGKDTNYFDTYNFQKLANAVDSIFIKETQIFGSNLFSAQNCITVTADNKLNVLVYDLFNDRVTSESSENYHDNGVMGFQRPMDFLLNTNLEANKQFSNECEVINIDSYYLETAEKDTISTLAHEFTHLLVFCHKYGYEDTWFTEMLAMCSEDIFQQTLGLTDNQTAKGRFNVTFNSPWKGFKNWPKGDVEDPDIGYLYANTYAFGAYLMRNYGGISLIQQIATNDYANEDAITMALQSLGFQEDFTTVLKKFGAIYVYTDSNTFYSLNKNVTQNISGTTYNLTAINLNDYVFGLYNSEAELIADLQTNWYSQERRYGRVNTNSGQKYAVTGTKIFNSNYILSDPIQTYGFVVFYLGTVNSNNAYSIKPVSNMTTIVCVKE